MFKRLKKKELVEREKCFEQALRDSESLANDFKIYLGIFRSNSLSQISNLSKEDYINIKQNPFYISKNEEIFRKSAKVFGIADKQTVLINEDNYALAFNPAVWCTLNLSQKVAAIKVANQKINGKEINQFVNYNSNGFVMCGENYDGAFNVGAFFRDDVDSLRVLQEIFDMNNKIKATYYFNKTRDTDYNTVLDFKTFEEMQYISPLEPSKELDKCNDETKAFFWDQIDRRKTREALLKSLDKLYVDCNPIKDLCKDLYKYIENTTKDIVNTNLFVIQQLGSNQKDRDRKYLKIKCDIFNNQNSDLDYVGFNDALKHFKNHFEINEKNSNDIKEDEKNYKL